MRQRGFTLLELAMVTAILGVLSSIAVGSYQLYVIKGQSAQTLTDYGHIRSVVAVETDANEGRDLHIDSVPGEVPPKLKTFLSDREFNGLDGLTLQMVSAPNGTFTSNPDNAVYALIARASGGPGERRLRVFRQALPHADGEKIWLSREAFIFPLDSNGDDSNGDDSNGDDSNGDDSNGDGGGHDEEEEIPEPPPEPVKPDSSHWTDTQPQREGDKGWTAHPQVCLYGQDKNPLSITNGQVQIRIIEEAIGADGRPTIRSDFLTQKSLVNGCAQFNLGRLPTAQPGQYGVTTVRVEVIALFAYGPPPVSAWDGKKPAAQIGAPQ